MRTAKPIYKRDIILNVRHRWLEQYAGYEDHRVVGWCPKTASQIRKELAALDLTSCTSEDIDNAVGSAGWAKNECDGCEGDFPVTIQIGDEPDYEARWQNLCPACLVELADFAANVPPKP